MSDGVREKRRICRKTCDKPHYPYELPKGWCWTTLSEITSIIGDGLHGTPQYDSSGNYYFINGNNLANRKIVIKEETKRISYDEYIKYRKPLNESTIFVSINGTIGNVGTYNGEKVILGKSACFFNLLPFLFKEYICSIIESDYFRKYALKSATGSTIKNVPLKAINDFYIPIAPLQEQMRIVGSIKLWLSLVNSIEGNKDNLQDTIKQAKSKILDLAIHGKLVTQDPTDEPAYELLKRINPKAEITCDTPQYENLPNGWCWTTIEEIGEIVTGSTPSKDIEAYYGGNIPFFKPADLEQGIHTASSKDRLTSLGFEQSRKLPIGSILVTCIGATIGKTGLTVIEGACNQQINAIIPRNVILPHYLYCICISDYMQNEIKTNASATTLPILNKGNFSKIILPLPPLQEQHRIFAKIEELFAQLDNIASSL